MTGIYLHVWAGGNEKDVLSDFEMPPETLDGAEILVASYDEENDEGTAYVLFRRAGKLYEVNASHCSCYGLSEAGIMGASHSQWEPEETTVEAVMHRVEKGWLPLGVKEVIMDTLK